MLAIISDIHANLEALTAVLDDIAQRDVSHIFCLGDVIGYGPQPQECLDLIMEKAEITLMGNHDCAVLYEPHRFNLGAETACYWTRRQLELEPDEARRNARWDFLGALPVKANWDPEDLDLGPLTFVHGSPRRPINEYIFPDDIFNSPNKVQGLFDRFEHVCFMGHTHVPGVFLDTPDFYGPDELENIFDVEPDRKALINVGSVGQPRDRDNRASYVLVGTDFVQFVRVEYPVDVVADKVYAIAELDDYQGTRLKEGR
jgi:predicted phosphodiesterase